MTILLQVQLLPSSPSPDEKSLKQKRDHPKAVSSRSGKRDSNAGSPASAFHVLPSVGCADSSLGEQSRVRVRTKSPSNKKKETTRRQSLLRAENETRTRDPNLGKVVLYQLSYFRKIFDFALNLAAARHRIDSLRSPCTNFPHFPYGSASSF